MRMLKAIQAGQYDVAEKIREQFVPLEDLRNSINPVRVLHEAVRADILPSVPKLRNLDQEKIVAGVRLVVRIGLPGAHHAGRRVDEGAARVAETHGCGRPDGFSQIEPRG